MKGVERHESFWPPQVACGEDKLGALSPQTGFGRLDDYSSAWSSGVQNDFTVHDQGRG